MSSTSYPEHTARKSISGQWTTTARLLIISLGLFWFSNNFPFYRFLEPQSMGWVLWASYAKDLIQPFAFYFLLCLGERWLKTWQTKAFVAIAIPILLEVGQGLYYQFSPSRYIGAFDPLDIVMYAISVALAVTVEQRVIKKAFKFW